MNPATTSRPRTDGCKSRASRFEETRSRTRNDSRTITHANAWPSRRTKARSISVFQPAGIFCARRWPSRSRTSRITIWLAMTAAFHPASRDAAALARALYHMALYSRGRVFSLGGGEGSALRRNEGVRVPTPSIPRVC